MDDQTVFTNIMKSGGPAFPQSIGMPNGGTAVAYGMSLRDWFAGQALAGICANADISAAAARDKIKTAAIREAYAESAYATADEMLRARA
jgi:hypothetical protein